jgi:hypothetical protein
MPDFANGGIKLNGLPRLRGARDPGNVDAVRDLTESERFLLLTPRSPAFIRRKRSAFSGKDLRKE